jgi:guanosine-3',5'-bis(diphosphate) 3'-pyrophosphohydrolase
VLSITISHLYHLLFIYRGSSVLDFAYKVHTDLGAHCTGAKVNGRIASIRYLLQNGDVVQVMTSKTQSPKREWLKHVRTSKAKSRIKAWLKRHQKENSASVGKKQIEEGLNKYSRGDDAGKREYQRKLDHLLTTFKLRDENHLFTALGYGQLSLQNVMTEIFGSAAIATVNNDTRPDSSTRTDRDSQILNKSQSVTSEVPPSNSNGIVVGRERNILLSFCRNCSPLRGDNIKGVITKGKGIKVHRTGCKYLSESDDTHVVDVTWDKSEKNVNMRPVQLQVICSDSPGVLADMSRAITSLGMNIGNVSLKKIKNGRGLARFEVMLGNLEDLNKLMVQLRQEEGVLSVSRR